MGLSQVLKAAGKPIAKMVTEVDKAATWSKTRLQLGELGAKTAGQARSLRQKIQQLDKIEDKDSEKAQLLESAISDLRKRLPTSVVKKVMESLKPDMNKGGVVKKAMMMRGGMAKKKKMMGGGMAMTRKPMKMRDGGLTAKQKTLPMALQNKIMGSKKKK